MADRAMLTLTVHQPYAWAIVHGFKDVENRSWSPMREALGRWLLVHAGKQVANEEPYAAARWVVREAGGDLPPASAMVHGAIVGAVRLASVTSFALYESRRERSPWATGPICWLLGDAIAFPAPIPCRGAQGLWEAPEGLRGEVRNQWRAAS